MSEVSKGETGHPHQGACEAVRRKVAPRIIWFWTIPVTVHFSPKLPETPHVCLLHFATFKIIEPKLWLYSLERVAQESRHDFERSRCCWWSRCASCRLCGLIACCCRGPSMCSRDPCFWRSLTPDTSQQADSHGSYAEAEEEDRN